MRYYPIACGLLLFMSCVQAPRAPESLSSRAPAVLSVAPGAGAKISMEPRLAVFFSQPIDKTTLGDASLLLVKGNVEETDFRRTTDLYKAIDKGTFPSVALERLLRRDHKTLLLRAQETLDPSTVYSLVVTPRILSEDRVPLQEGEEEKCLLVSFETVADDTEVGEDALPEIGTLFDAADAEAASPLPDAPAGGTGSETTGSEGPAQESPSASPPVENAGQDIQGKVVINEIYYDAVGSDTDGVVFVELYGAPGLVIGNAKVAFVDGGDGSVDDTITLPEDARIPADGFYVIADARTGMATATTIPGADLIDNFDPQNGPDAVQLIDKDGNLVDAVAYGEGVVPIAENGLATGEGTPAPDVVNGHSLERRMLGVDLSDNINDFVENEAPTPGM